MDKRVWLRELLKYIKNPYNRLDEVKFNQTCLVYLYNYSTAPGPSDSSIKDEILRTIQEINDTDPEKVLGDLQKDLFGKKVLQADASVLQASTLREAAKSETLRQQEASLREAAKSETLRQQEATLREAAAAKDVALKAESAKEAALREAAAAKEAARTAEAARDAALREAAAASASLRDAEATLATIKAQASESGRSARQIDTDGNAALQQATDATALAERELLEVKKELERASTALREASVREASVKTDAAEQLRRDAEQHRSALQQLEAAKQAALEEAEAAKQAVLQRATEANEAALLQFKQKVSDLETATAAKDAALQEAEAAKIAVQQESDVLRKALGEAEAAKGAAVKEGSEANQALLREGEARRIALETARRQLKTAKHSVRVKQARQLTASRLAAKAKAVNIELRTALQKAEAKQAAAQAKRRKASPVLGDSDHQLYDQGHLDDARTRSLQRKSRVATRREPSEPDDTYFDAEGPEESEGEKRENELKKQLEKRRMEAQLENEMQAKILEERLRALQARPVGSDDQARPLGPDDETRRIQDELRQIRRGINPRPRTEDDSDSDDEYSGKAKTGLLSWFRRGVGGHRKTVKMYNQYRNPRDQAEYERMRKSTQHVRETSAAMARKKAQIDYEEETAEASRRAEASRKAKAAEFAQSIRRDPIPLDLRPKTVGYLDSAPKLDRSIGVQTQFRRGR
jgi:hypothetical protein